MKRITPFFTLAAIIFAVGCRPSEDTRYFAPVVSFAQNVYTTSSERGSLEVSILLSRPAPRPFTVGLNASGQLKEDLQFRLERHSVEIAAGDREARFSISLMDDEIWDESSWFELTLAPGTYYTVNPDENATTRINVTKEILIPILRLIPECETPVITNPYLAESLGFTISAQRGTAADIPVKLGFGDLAAGADYLIDGKEAAQVVLPAGAREVDFTVQILKKDISGYDRHARLEILSEKGIYAAASDAGSVDIHLSDPSVDFSPLLRTVALNEGKGFQVRQAILSPSKEWNGNTAVDLSVSSDGSNYLRNHRNQFYSQWLCMANSPGANILRLTEFFPDLLYPNDFSIIDYGAASNTRTFSPADSIFRFVPDRGNPATGRLMLERPRSFVAMVGYRTQWEAGSNPNKAWQLDSKATGGDIFSSNSSIITGRITVELVRLEGRYDLTNSAETLLFTAWLRSDSPYFMQNVDESMFAVIQEDGLWKVTYKLWPRS